MNACSSPSKCVPRRAGKPSRLMKPHGRYARATWIVSLNDVAESRCLGGAQTCLFSIARAPTRSPLVVKTWEIILGSPSKLPSYPGAAGARRRPHENWAGAGANHIRSGDKSFAALLEALANSAF
jgi:hypothetical protein